MPKKELLIWTLHPSISPPRTGKGKITGFVSALANLSALPEHLKKVSLDQTVLHLQNVAEASVLVITLL
jgi:hypothetical protein